MNEVLEQSILSVTNSTKVKEGEIIQTLWSGYGKIQRLHLEGEGPETLIVKHISPPVEMNHPRGWNTNKSHQRKLKSYEIETNWYQWYEDKLSDEIRIPKCYLNLTIENEQFLLLEDLDSSGYPVRLSELTISQVKLCLSWLAKFHGCFMNTSPNKLWPIGTYWHLDTRPDELIAMEDGELKRLAHKIDKTLNNCKFKTLVHGDAKVANFCFNVNGDQVAALDFQYVGGGCGMKDVIYLLGSCLNNRECEKREGELLSHYFSELKASYLLDHFEELENEWRRMYPIAWTDFTRFLEGWMPDHHKLNGYSKTLMKQVLEVL